MAQTTFKLPDIGEGIAAAEIVAWHVAVGDTVAEDQPLVDMMTDKATVEIECPVAGRVVALGGALGEAVPIGAMLAVIEVEGEDADADAVETAAAPPVAAIAPDTPIPAAASTPAAQAPAPSHRDEAPLAGTSRKVLASPAVRARAKALGVDLAQVHAEGSHIRHADLDAFLRYGSAQGYAPAAAPRADEAIPVIGLRRRIAENMAAAKAHIPHFTYIEEVEVTALEAIRADLNTARGDRPRLTLLPFLVTALARALVRFPMLNARYDDAAQVVTRHGALHLGIATQTDSGLMVPVLRDAHALNIWQIAAEVARLAATARDGGARREDLSGSTFTLTSLGPLGGIASTPIINRPEVAILGVGRIIERHVFLDDSTDRLRRAKLMNLSIACDHRVVDGHDAASFVAHMKQMIEAPALLLAP